MYLWLFDYIYAAKRLCISFISHEESHRYQNKGGQIIIVIPGVYENWHFMQPLISFLHVNAYDVHVIKALERTTGTIDDMADIVHTYIANHDLHDVILVSHSKGGLIGKRALIMDVHTAIRGLVAINAPFSGSKYAHLIPFKSFKTFIPNSVDLIALTADTIVNARITSLYGMFDQHIPEGSYLDGARNVQVNGAYGHFKVLNNAAMKAEVIRSISLLQ